MYDPPLQYSDEDIDGESVFTLNCQPECSATITKHLIDLTRIKHPDSQSKLGVNIGVLPLMTLDIVELVYSKNKNFLSKQRFPHEFLEKLASCIQVLKTVMQDVVTFVNDNKLNAKALKFRNHNYQFIDTFILQSYYKFGKSSLYVSHLYSNISKFFRRSTKSLFSDPLKIHSHLYFFIDKYHNHKKLCEELVSSNLQSLSPIVFAGDLNLSNLSSALEMIKNPDCVIIAPPMGDLLTKRNNLLCSYHSSNPLYQFESSSSLPVAEYIKQFFAAVVTGVKDYRHRAKIFIAPILADLFLSQRVPECTSLVCFEEDMMAKLHQRIDEVNIQLRDECFLHNMYVFQTKSAQYTKEQQAFPDMHVSNYKRTLIATSLLFRSERLSVASQMGILTTNTKLSNLTDDELWSASVEIEGKDCSVETSSKTTCTLFIVREQKKSDGYRSTNLDISNLSPADTQDRSK